MNFAHIGLLAMILRGPEAIVEDEIVAQARRAVGAFMMSFNHGVKLPNFNVSDNAEAAGPVACPVMDCDRPVLNSSILVKGIGQMAAKNYLIVGIPQQAESSPDAVALTRALES
jgi:hypothetical protein